MINLSFKKIILKQIQIRYLEYYIITLLIIQILITITKKQQSNKFKSLMKLNIPQIEPNIIEDYLVYLHDQKGLKGIIFQHTASNIDNLIQYCQTTDQWIKQSNKGYKSRQQKNTLQKAVNLICSGNIQGAIDNFIQSKKFSEVDLQYTPMVISVLVKYFQMYEYLYAALQQIEYMKINQEKNNKMIKFIYQSDKIRKGQIQKYQQIDETFIEDHLLSGFAKWVINNSKNQVKQQGNQNQQSGDRIEQIKGQIKQENQQKPVIEDIVSKYEKMLKNLETQKQKFNKKKVKLIQNLQKFKVQAQQWKQKNKKSSLQQQLKTLSLKNTQIDNEDIEKLCQIVLRNSKIRKQKQLKIINYIYEQKIENKAPQPQTIPSVPAVVHKTQFIDKQYKKVKKSQITKLKNLLDKKQQLRYDLRQEYEQYLKQKVKQLFDSSSQLSLYKLITQSIQKYIQQLSSSSNNFTLTELKHISQQPKLQSIIPFPSLRSQLFLHNIFLGFNTNSYTKPAKQYPEQREYLVQVLQSYVKKRILRTKLLFQHDKINLLNFHQYADDISNYVVIVKLNNNMMIAGYSQQQLNQKSSNTGPGFISSLSNKKTLYINTALSGARTTKYDQYYIIFGNDQFRIQPNAKQVISYLGYQYSYYRPKMEPKQLFGQARETCPYVGLEIHKVVFQGQENEVMEGKIEEVKKM